MYETDDHMQSQRLLVGRRGGGEGLEGGGEGDEGAEGRWEQGRVTGLGLGLGRLGWMAFAWDCAVRELL